MAAAARLERAEAYFRRFLDKVQRKPVTDGEEATLKAAIQRVLEGKASNSNATGFPGMQPASLDNDNMFKIARRKDDYYVCEKTDGERYLLLLYGGESFLVNRKHKFFRIPCRVNKAAAAAAGGAPVRVGAPVPVKFMNTEKHMPLLNPSGGDFGGDFAAGAGARVTLLDGELTAEFTDPPSLTYYVFDSILVHGRSVQDLALADRLKLALNCVVFPLQNPKWRPPGPGAFRIMMKEMFRVRTPGATEHLLNHVIPLLQHENDGLIFTPNTLNYRAGTTYEILKWKPKHLNTIDFMLDLKYRGVDSTPRYTINVKDNNMARFVDWVDVPAKYFGRVKAHTIVECTFHEDGHVTRYECPRGQGSMTMDGNRLTWDDADEQQLPLSERISDIAFEMYAGEGCWRIHRLREDKSAPNHVHIVKRIFKSIKDAVDKTELLACINGTAVEPVAKKQKTKYWIEPQDGQKRDRTQSKSVGMKNFHNTVVKAKLYRKYVRESSSLMELAGGQGGDMNRWMARGPQRILLADLDPTALVEAQRRWDGEIAERNWKKSAPARAGLPRPKFATIAADLRQPLALADVAAAAARTLPGGGSGGGSGASSSSSALSSPPAAARFDTVSCQFALHYMFDTPASLFNCLRALDGVVRPSGGHFMATLYSGHAVERLMRAQPLNSAPQPQHEKRWVIDGVAQATITMDPAVVLPSYDPADAANRAAVAALASRLRSAEAQGPTAADAAFLAPFCGRRIEVEVDTIGGRHPEYLVDLGFLSALLGGLGFVQLENRSFGEYYAEHEAETTDGPRVPEMMKTFSFLYHACAWRRR